MSKRTRYEGSPTLARVMVRPQWILALILSLAVAGGFALLAQWQMGSAVKLQETELDSETTYPIHELTATGTPVTDTTGGRMVSADLSLVPGDSFVVGNRVNQGETGYWVVSHFSNEEADEHLTVAIGWAPTLDAAEVALAQADTDASLTTVHEVIGRYLPSEGTSVPSPGETFDSLSTGQSINLWDSWEGTAFAGYLVAENSVDNLDTIDSYEPLPEEKVNWLNLFYAIEWVVFAGFAVFFWYRLARDAWEKEHELKELLAGSSDDPGVQ